MCLAVPLRVEEINGKEGICEFDGVRRKVRLDFVPKVKIGDYVLVHAGFAIEIIKEEEAIESRDAYKELFDAIS